MSEYKDRIAKIEALAEAVADRGQATHLSEHDRLWLLEQLRAIRRWRDQERRRVAGGGA